MEPEPDVDPCKPQDEVCDGEDNDCDGDVDEDFDVDTACSVGVGACAVDGTNVCNAAGDGVECDAEALEPTSNELCGDGIDNDCDGEVDEDFDLGAACTAGVGVCETDGVLVCETASGAAVCDAVPLDPPEDPDELTCDALDNDCDGEVDEGCDDDLDGFCDAAFTLVSPDGGVHHAQPVRRWAAGGDMVLGYGRRGLRRHLGQRRRRPGYRRDG